MANEITRDNTVKGLAIGPTTVATFLRVRTRLLGALGRRDEDGGIFDPGHDVVVVVGDVGLVRLRRRD